MPIVVDGIKTDGRSVKELRERAGGNAGETQEQETQGFVALGKIGVEKKPNSKARKCKRAPRKNWKKPWLRLIEDVDAVDVRLERPGKKVGPKSGPQGWRGHGYDSRNGDGSHNRVGAGGRHRISRGKETKNAHQNHRKAEDIEDIHAKEISPRGIAERKGILLNTEKNSEGKDFCSAANGPFCDGTAVGSLFAQAFGNERERDSRQKNEKWCGKCAAELGPDKDGRFTGFRTEP